MIPDDEGFSYPSVDETLCIECGLCELVCPVTLKKMNKEHKIRSFVVRSVDKNTVLKSTSGGLFTPLANYFLENEGIVYAACFDGDFSVVHKALNKSDLRVTDFSRFRGSKYVQSYMGSNYVDIRSNLELGYDVCFIGTTCQVSGLKSFLRKEYDNLFTVDLVCHGVPSPKLWKKYLDYQKEKYCSDIVNVNFRNKTYGYHSGTMKIEFANGRVYYGSARVDYMLKSFFMEIASRPICYNCPFKELERCSDLTIYDCWHPSKLVAGLKDDDLGYTNVITQTEKGFDMINNLEFVCDMYEVDTERAVGLDGIMIRNSAVPHPKRNEFYRNLDNDTIEEHINKFIPICWSDYIVEKVKLPLYKLGFIQWVRKLKKLFKCILQHFR